MISHHFFNVYQRLSLVKPWWNPHGFSTERPLLECPSRIPYPYVPRARNINPQYPLVMSKSLIIENDHLQWVFPIKIWWSSIAMLVYRRVAGWFGKSQSIVAGWWFPLWLGGFMWFPKIWWILKLMTTGAPPWLRKPPNGESSPNGLKGFTYFQVNVCDSV